MASCACQSVATATPVNRIATPLPAISPTPESGAANATSAPATEPVVDGEIVGPGDFDLQSPGAGLAGLASYRATLTLTFDGTRAGQPEQWSRTYNLLVSREPAARLLTIESVGATTGQLVWVEANGVRFERRDGGVCTVAPVLAEQSLAERWELTTFLSALQGAESAGSEVVNGLATDHYTFDERATGEAGLATSTGEVWTAATGGYVVRYRLATTAEAAYFGDGREGTATWDYALIEPNVPITIDTPSDCPSGLVDAPQMQDAAGIVSVPGLLSYTTAAAPAAVAAFYQQELLALGWQSTTDPTIGADGAWFEFAQENQVLSVIIAAGGPGTVVQLVQTTTSP
jgi:hypothetical protein